MKNKFIVFAQMYTELTVYKNQKVVCREKLYGNDEVRISAFIDFARKALENDTEYEIGQVIKAELFYEGGETVEFIVSGDGKDLTLTVK